MLIRETKQYLSEHGRLVMLMDDPTDSWNPCWCCLPSSCFAGTCARLCLNLDNGFFASSSWSPPDLLRVALYLFCVLLVLAWSNSSERENDRFLLSVSGLFHPIEFPGMRHRNFFVTNYASTKVLEACFVAGSVCIVANANGLCIDACLVQS